MKYSLYLLCVLFLFFPKLNLFAQENIGMTNEIMGRILKSEATNIEGQLGNWQVLYRELPIFILTDESNNRMRIFTPFAQSTELESTELNKMLEANFHSALDAKYSMFEGFVISVYTHPLRELTRDQFVDAMGQVVNLAQNFGTTYSSTSLIFGGGENKMEKTEEQKKEERTNKKPGQGKS